MVPDFTWMIFSLVIAVSSFAVSISDAGNTTVASKNNTNKCVPTTRTKPSVYDEPECVPYGLDKSLFVNGGYCKHVLGNLPVYGTKPELYSNEMKMNRYQMVKDFVFQVRRGNHTKKQWKVMDIAFEVRQSCLDAADDFYCHHYFKRCYISSSPQQVCRETCEELFFNLCDREYEMVKDFNLVGTKNRYPYAWDIVDCTTLPLRNESNNCYFPNKLRGKLDVLESKDCFYGDGRGYRGNMSSTVSGYACQLWNEQCPHVHQLATGDVYKEISNSSNFCRNPGGLGLNGTWCFTTNRTVRWEYCDVPRCAKEPPSSPPADFRGQNSSSTSIQLFWGDVQKASINGILLGFHVVCRRHNSSELHFKDLGDGVKRWEFKRLEKFTNYSCRLRAYNNFGNGTWSGEVVISTDEDVPSATVEYLEAWNLSSTSLHVQWGPTPFSERHGKILGYDVEIRAQHGKFGQSKPKSNYTNTRSLTFSGLQKYCMYVITVCALTRRGKGPSRTLTASTDEDVPDRPPQDILVSSQGKHAVQVNWRPVPPEYTNGEVLGYKVFYSDANTTSPVNISATETRTKIDGLRPSTNYSFQILAFTAKGDGTISTKYFAKTQSDPVKGLGYEAPGSGAGMGTVVQATVFSGILALGAVLLVIYFIRKKRLAIANDRNDLNCVTVTPYATSSIDWIERIIATNYHGYEPLDDENVPPTRRTPLYINIAPDGSLDLPQHLKNIVLEFEQSYENTHYRRLSRRRRSLGGAVDNCGRPIYDRLQRMISPIATNQSESYSPEAQSITIAAERSKEIKQHQSVDLGEIGKFMQCLEGDQCSIALAELGGMRDEIKKSCHRRRFSVDLGEVREFIELTEVRASRTNESTELAYQPGPSCSKHG